MDVAAPSEEEVIFVRQLWEAAVCWFAVLVQLESGGQLRNHALAFFGRDRRRGGLLDAMESLVE